MRQIVPHSTPPAPHRSGFEGGHPCEPGRLIVGEKVANLLLVSCQVLAQHPAQCAPALVDELGVVSVERCGEALHLLFCRAIERVLGHLLSFVSVNSGGGDCSPPISYSDRKAGKSNLNCQRKTELLVELGFLFCGSYVKRRSTSIWRYEKNETKKGTQLFANCIEVNCFHISIYRQVTR